MPNHHQATPDEWAQQANWAADRRSSGSSCIVELRGRIEALEAAQHAHIEATAAEAGARRAVEHLSKPGSWQPLRAFTADEVAPIVVPPAEPAADAQQLTLVERVQAACDNAPLEHEARPAIRVVAEWLRAGALSDWGLAAADLLDNEVNR